jgi:hypothetical protein
MCAAMKAAGVRQQRCPVHPEHLKPCLICERAFSKAHGQRAEQRQAEQKRAHAEFIASGGRVR